MTYRRKQRIYAMQALYRWDMVVDESNKDIFSWVEKGENLEYAQLLFQGTTKNYNTVDDVIHGSLENWSLDRLHRVDLAILRLSVFTLLFHPDIPPAVVIDEAVEISKSFSDHDSPPFIHGVLDSIIQNRKKNNDPS